MSRFIYFCLENVTTNYMLLFLIIFVASEWCFLYFEKLIINKTYFKLKEKWIFSTINGVLLTSFTICMGEKIPVIMMIISPSIFIVELFIMSKDQLSTYFCCGIKIMNNFISFYWMVVSVLGLFSAENVNGRIIFPITVFISGLWCFFLSQHCHYPINELKLMIHNRRIGMLYFSFQTVCTISLFFSTLLLSPILMKDMLDTTGILTLFYMEIFLKTSLIFWSGYILLIIEAKKIKQKENIMLLSLNLEREESFRKGIWQDNFLSFYVNISRNKIEEGRDLFTPFMWDNVSNFTEMVRKMGQFCVHPEELKEFFKLNNIREIENKLSRREYTAKQEMRVSSVQMLLFFNLPDNIKEQYEKTNEKWVWIKVGYVYIQDSQNGDIGVYVSIVDIDKEKKAMKVLENQATTDKLTGISNRIALQQKIEKRIVLSAKENKNAGIMILLDIDYFKTVNDVLGHPFGDGVLQSIAAILKDAFRYDDIVGRLGGDEFCVFINQVIEEKELRKRLSNINEKCQKEYPVEGKESIQISVSIGAVLCTPEITAFSQLYELADKALYETKNKGKNGYTIFLERNS